MKDEWYCKTMGIEFGPMAFDDLAALVERGNLRPIDPVRNAESSAWSKAADLPQLAPYLPQTPPAAAPAKDAAEKKPPPRAAAKAAETQTPVKESPALLPLDRYNCAILIGADGVSVCDLRGCQPVVLAGATLVGHRSADDDTAIRFGPFELQISIRERAPATEPVPPAAVVVPETAAAEAEFDVAEAPPAPTTSKPKPPAKRPPAESETRDAAAEMLRRMFMPQPSKSR